MKYQKIAQQYDEVYSKDANAFSGEPLPLVRGLAERMHSGSVLEIGAGSGRNALFLAGKGFEVVATDISPASVALLQKRAEEEKVSLHAQVLDVAADKLLGNFDAIICTFTLHHLEREDALSAIRKIQDHTKIGGYNVLTTFTKDGDFFRKNPQAPFFFLDGKQELENLYSGWALHKSFEKEGPAREPDAAGNKQMNVFAGLLAQKP